MKKIVYSLCSALLFVLVAAGVLVGCSKQGPESISVEAADMPQTIFVLGEEPDFSKGQLTLTYSGGETEKIPLTDPAVSVAGYDKTKTGKQDLTVSYGELTTSLTVTTVPRMTPDDAFVKGYFLGETLDRAGNLRITRNDGTSFSVSFSDEKITATGFDSSSAGSRPLSVTYTDGTETFTDEISLTYYEEGKATIRIPSKTTYLSHESLDLRGGRVTVTSKDEEFSKDIPLTEEMISGFDLSQAGLGNRETALVQTVTITYKPGVTRDFLIQIYFSDVSYFRYVAKELSEYKDWTSSFSGTISDAEGAIAMEAISAFTDTANGIKQEERIYLTEEEIETVARVAAVYGYKKWETQLQSFNKTFVIEQSGGQYSFGFADGITYENAKAAYERLQNSADDYYTYSDFLASMKADAQLAAVTMYEDAEGTLSSYLGAVLSSSDFKTLSVPLIKYLVDLYDDIATVPAEWTAEDLTGAAYASAINRAYNAISAKLNDAALGALYANRDLYSIVVSWRDDFFDILYTYFLGQVKSSENDDGVKEEARSKLRILASYCYLPGDLETLHSYLGDAQYYRSMLTAVIYDQHVYFDTTRFLLNYLAAVEVYNEIIGADNDLYNDILEEVTMFGFYPDQDGMIMVAYFADLMQDMKYASYNAFPIGYYAINGAGTGLEAFEEFQNSYLEMGSLLAAKNWSAESVKTDEALKTAISGTFKKFVALNPAEQLAALCSLNAYYGDKLFFDEQYKGETYFAQIVSAYYSYVLGEEQYKVFNELLVSLEHFIRREVAGDREGEILAFLQGVKKAKEDYDALSDKAAFEENAQFLLDKCEEIYNLYTFTDDSISSFKIGEDDLTDNDKELLSTAETYYYSLNLLMNSATDLQPYSALYVLYDKAYGAAQAILADGSENLKNLFYYGYTSIEQIQGSHNLNYEFMFLFRTFRNSYMQHQTVVYNGTPTFLDDLYYSEELNKFFDEAWDIMNVRLKHFYGVQFGEGGEEALIEGVSPELPGELLEKFQALTLEKKILALYTDNGISNLFFSGLQVYYSVQFGWSVDPADLDTSVLFRLFSFYRSLCLYEDEIQQGTSLHGVSFTALSEAYQNLTAAYENLETADKDKFDGALKTFYESVLQEFNELNESN